MTMIILAVKAEHAYTGVWECLVFQLAHICHALRFFPAAAAVDTVQHMHIFHLMPSSHFASKPLLYIAWACLKASAMSQKHTAPWLSAVIKVFPLAVNMHLVTSPVCCFKVAKQVPSL